MTGAPPEDPISVLIVDDHQLVREGLALLLRNSGLGRLYEASNGREAVRVALESRPRVVLMDILMPHMDGIEACRQIKEGLPGAAVVMLTTYDDAALLRRALEAGASGYLLKGSSRAVLLDAIKAAASGISAIDTGILARMGAELAASDLSEEERISLESLSPRETAILACIARGMTNAQIAQTFSYSVGTIKNATQSIITKLGVSDRVQAAVLAARAGLLSQEP
jgi:DNA-binding NarL/FixJ family response regulator